MALTSAQLTTLKNDIAANTAAIPENQSWTGAFAGMQVKDVPNNGDGNFAVAGWYNQTASPAHIVWRDLPMETILGLITYASMTPADAVPTSPDSAVQVWKARSLACQGKQFNLQNLTIGRSTAPMKRTNYRAAMQDCLTNLPAGASGNLIAANWVGVRDAAKFSATYAEKLFATGTGSTATPADLGYEGAITGDDAEQARNS
jgi:hypothetical protein